MMPAPAPGQPFYGQDAQFAGRPPSYRDNGDGAISDLNTGLVWVKARGAQVSWTEALTNAANCRVGGYEDWRAPTIKELYSLVKFTGANGSIMTNPAGYIPFLDTNYFGFAYGGTSTNALSCATGDADGDVADNGGEYAADTDPTNAASRFRLTGLGNAPPFAVWFPSSASRVYSPYATTNLLTGPWTSAPTQSGLLGNGGAASLADLSPTNTPCFYRVEVRPP